MPPPPPPRLTTRFFPPYAFVPGMHPHPISDPSGHRCGDDADDVAPADVAAIRQSHRWAVDLFNHGYYWESHEAWERLWILAGRRGPQADFLKGLIKLAAAAVKARQGQSQGVRRHAQRAAELFQIAADDRTFPNPNDLGLAPQWLAQQSRLCFKNADAIVDMTACDVRRVFSFVLEPHFTDEPLH